MTEYIPITLYHILSSSLLYCIPSIFPSNSSSHKSVSSRLPIVYHSLFRRVDLLRQNLLCLLWHRLLCYLSVAVSTDPTMSPTCKRSRQKLTCGTALLSVAWLLATSDPVSWILLGTTSSTFLGSFSCNFWGTLLSPTAWEREVESDIVLVNDGRLLAAMVIEIDFQ